MAPQWLSLCVTAWIILGLIPCSAPDLSEKGESIGCIDGRCFYYISTRASWEDAKSACGAEDGYLATVADEDTHELLSEFIKFEEESAWIGGQHVKLDEWTWLSNEEYDGDVDEDSGSPSCGAIDGDDDEFELLGAACSEAKPYICGDPSETTGTCFHNVAITQDEVSWHRARERCRETDRDLAVLSDGCARDGWAFLRSDEETQEEYWIGLYRRRWTWHENNEEIVDTYFRSSEPDGDGQRCLEYCSNGLWCDKRCSTTNRYICMTDGHPPSLSLQPSVIGFALLWTIQQYFDVV